MENIFMKESLKELSIIYLRQFPHKVSHFLHTEKLQYIIYEQPQINFPNE
jgi:hypothetical protein